MLCGRGVRAEFIKTSNGDNNDDADDDDEAAWPQPLTWQFFSASFVTLTLGGHTAHPGVRTNSLALIIITVSRYPSHQASLDTISHTRQRNLNFPSSTIPSLQLERMREIEMWLFNFPVHSVEVSFTLKSYKDFVTSPYSESFLFAIKTLTFPSLILCKTPADHRANLDSGREKYSGAGRGAGTGKVTGPSYSYVRPGLASPGPQAGPS